MRNKTLTRIVRFGIVGIVNTGIDLAIFNALMDATGIERGAAIAYLKAAAFAIALINSYFWNKYWTFSRPRGKAAPPMEFGAFIVVSMVGLLANTVIATALVNFLTIPPFLNMSQIAWNNIAALIATAGNMITNFIGYNFIVFRRNELNEAKERAEAGRSGGQGIGQEPSRQPSGKYKIGFTCSSFDLLHAGHMAMLKDCKNVCEYLIVGLQTDPTLDPGYRDKIKNKPVMSFEERRTLLEGVRYIDEIVEYSTEADLYALLSTINYDVRILGSDWKGKKYTGWDLPHAAYFHERNHSYSTSELRKRVYDAEAARLASEELRVISNSPLNGSEFGENLAPPESLSENV